MWNNNYKYNTQLCLEYTIIIINNIYKKKNTSFKIKIKKKQISNNI
jgi:hypothetical protein